jgi:hypothetical protein
MAQDLTQKILAERPTLPPREVDEIVRFCTSGSHREQGRLVLINMPSATDRQFLAARVKALLDSFRHHDRKEIAALIADMLASYDVAQAKQLSAADRKLVVAVYVRELGGLPTWAVLEACNRIRLGTAPDISHAYKPTAIQVRTLAVSIAQPWKGEALLISEVLGAKAYREEIADEERGRVLVKWQSLSEALHAGALGEPGLRQYWQELEAQRRERTLARMTETSRTMIVREWAASGEQPPPGMPVSRGLVGLLGAQTTKKPFPQEEDA